MTSVAEDFDRGQRRVLNEKLLQKVDELEALNREQEQLLEHLREAQGQTAESLSLLETLQSTAPAGFGFVDRDFRIVRMNETLALVNGMPADQQIGRKVADVVPMHGRRSNPSTGTSWRPANLWSTRRQRARFPGGPGRLTSGSRAITPCESKAR